MNAGLLGILAALGWGTADYAARFSGRAIGPANALLGMLISGSIFLSVWVWYSGVSFIWAPDYTWLLATTGVSTMLATLFIYKALSIGPISVAAPIVASYPVLVVLASVVKGQFPTLFEIGVIAMVMAGVVLVARADSETHSDGDRDEGASVVWLALAGSFFLSISITSGQEAATHFGELQATWIGRLISLFCILCLFLLPRNEVQIPFRWWPIVAAQGLLDSVAFLLTFAGGNTENPEITAVIGSSFGCVTVFLAWIFLKERITGVQWAGIAMVIMGSATLSM